MLVAGCTGMQHSPRASGLTDWPRIPSAIANDEHLEAQVLRIVSSMTLAQKVGQMTQAEIGSITPAQVTEFYIGSILNGGGSWPHGDKFASCAEWISLSDAWHKASMATDMVTPIPLLWGTDAVHGHGNVYGATLFPHNIGLGAANDAELVRSIGESVGRQVSATGIRWVFGPAVSVARNGRWGRTYESYSADPAVVRAYAAAFVGGMQGTLKDDGNVVATVKHFIGDGATENGQEKGTATIRLADMVNVHAQGYYGGLAAGAQAVMVSFNSWNDAGAGIDYGPLHGSKVLITDVLKGKMGFDGLVVSDWNGIEKVPGCTQAGCAQAINAGLDMVMVPEQWKQFIANTIAQVKSGEISMSRIDDAVSRILRVKLRLGVPGKSPSANVHACKAEALQARSLARRSVRESLVLLKNQHAVLPLFRDKKILVVGKTANSLQNQTGGWTLTWQGTDNANSSFPVGDTILTGIREVAGLHNVTYSETANGIDVRQFDTVIAVIGETPYAEGHGDIAPPATLSHSAHYPEDKTLLNLVAGRGTPVITVFVGGRPLYASDLLNLSDAWVVAWLPGTEGKGLADVLFRNVQGDTAHNFTGRLPFPWPATACQSALDDGDGTDPPLFSRGYGLRYNNETSASPAVPASDTLTCDHIAVQTPLEKQN